MATLIGDAFDDGDGVTLASHLMNTGPGGVPNIAGWTVHFGQFAISKPVANQPSFLSPITNNDGDRASCDAGAADYVLSCACTPTEGFNWENDANIAFRWFDPTNFWYVHLTSLGDAVQLNEVVAGSPVSRGVANLGTVVSGTTFRLAVVTRGPLIRVYVNGVLRISYGAATNFVTATRVGVYVGRAGAVTTKAKWKDFLVQANAISFRQPFDRVMESSIFVGLGQVTTMTVVPGYQTFLAVGNGQQCYISIWAVDGNGVPTGDWEVSGPETYSAPTGSSITATLSRTGVVLASSNGGNRINFPAGTKRVALVRTANDLTIPYVHAFNQGDISIPPLSQVYLPLNSHYEDSYGFHSNTVNNSRLTVPPGMDGVYVVTALVRWDISGVGGRSIVLQVNRFGVLAVQTIIPVQDPFTTTDQLITSPPVRLAAGDYVELYVTHSSNVPLLVKYGVSFSPNVGMWRIAT